MSSKTIFRKADEVISLPSGDFTVEEIEAYIRTVNLLMEVEK